MKVIRVFPRSTKATPNDADVRVGIAPGFFDEADEVWISVAFTWDLPKADLLYRQWKHVCPVKIGGPAIGKKSENFVPGRFLKPGYVITSRGCPNKCWFCSVWKREGSIRELPISEGWNVLDDNLLTCSDKHIKEVFSMLGKQKRKAVFTGGLEAKLLRPWHVEEIVKIKSERVFFAYDTPDDLEPLREAAKLIDSFGYRTRGHWKMCYVLCGYPKDTMEEAEKRLQKVLRIGMTPMAMLWMNDLGTRNKEWSKFQKKWARPHLIYTAGKKESSQKSFFDLFVK